jgi:hypothetical protein
VSVVHSVILGEWNYPNDALINARTLAYLMEQCQTLKYLSLRVLRSLNEDQLSVLGAFSRPGLEIVLESCIITDAGASALVDFLGRNQGPTHLDWCEIDYSVLAYGLRGNSRLKSLKVGISRNLEVRIREVLTITDALKENKGLADLQLGYDTRVSDEMWGAICASLTTHPTLEVLNLHSILGSATTDPVVLNSRYSHSWI